MNHRHVLLTSTVPGCWGGVCSHTQMGGVVTVIDPNLPRVIWLGNEISCKFLQYFGRLRFSESTCACCHVAYVAIFGLWIVRSGRSTFTSLTSVLHEVMAFGSLPQNLGTVLGLSATFRWISTRITVKWLDRAHGPGGQITGVKTFRNQKQMLLKISIK